MTAAAHQVRNADDNYYLILYRKKHLLTSGGYELKSQTRLKNTKCHMHGYVHTCAKLKGWAPNWNVAFLSLKQVVGNLSAGGQIYLSGAQGLPWKLARSSCYSL